MDIEELNRISRNSFIEHLGIRFLDFDGHRITASLEIKPFHLQPAGVVHGGVYISLAETVAGAGSVLLVRRDGKLAYGTVVSSQHIAKATEGTITAVGKLVHKGFNKHIWDVKINDRNGKLISMSRVTNSITEMDQDTIHHTIQNRTK
ncbi:MAG: PaaI family thioesterase [Bacteroidales bacterium]|nr:PaaI family thioesterase [Bacteroidales bacterium]